MPMLLIQFFFLEEKLLLLRIVKKTNNFENPRFHGSFSMIQTPKNWVNKSRGLLKKRSYFHYSLIIHKLLGGCWAVGCEKDFEVRK
jgi:hypothetical protein